MPPVVKPEAVLKRSEELINVGQASAALQALHEFTYSRRFKQGPSTALEPMMERLMELCVDQRRGRPAKEALMQYKNAFQNTDPQSIRNVIYHLIKHADAKVTEARSRADAAAEDVDVDDLEESETPESILLGSVSQDQERDRTDRTMVTPWLKFLWETYRTALDILKNNTRLEIAYHQVAHKALQFCLQHRRKTEFRRLCEVLRQHLQSVARSAHHTNVIDFSDADTLQRHLDTRFTQLNIAVELELWQEAFRSVEDVHNLLTIAKKAPKAAMMANYYEKLARIFIVSDNQLFHAAAWNKYYALARLSAHTEADQSRMASFVLLSALAVPVIASGAPGTGNLSKGRSDFLQGDADARQRTGRLNALLGLNRTPTRAGLLREALSRNVLRRARPELRELYHILEVEFHPLSICAKIEPILAQVAKDPNMAKYVKPLHAVVLTRLFQQLSQVYDSVKMEQVMQLVSAFKAPYHYTSADVEKFCLNACKRGHLNLRIDHISKAVTFQDDVFAADVHPAVSGSNERDLVRLQATPSELVRTQLARLAESLDATLRVVDPGLLQAAQEHRQTAFARAIAEADKEHQLAIERKAQMERRKELLREMAKKKAEEEAAAKAERDRLHAESEQRRLAEEQRQRELDHVRKEMEAVKLEEARKMAQSLKEKGGLKLTDEEFASLDTEKLVRLQVEHIEREKKELTERLRTVQRRMDHLERAYRREELPLIAADYERQQKEDLENHKRAYEVQRAQARERFEHDMAAKKVLSRVVPDYDSMRELILTRRQKEYEERKAHAAVQIEKEKEQRRADLMREREEQERRHAEEAKQQEEEARLTSERHAQAEQQAELEQKRRQEIEERQTAMREQAERQAPPPRMADNRFGGPPRPSADEGGAWRRSGPPSGASDPMFANRRYQPGDLGRTGRAPESRAPPPPMQRPSAPSSGASGRYQPGAFSRSRNAEGDAPTRAPPSEGDGFTQVKPRTGAYRPPSAR